MPDFWTHIIFGEEVISGLDERVKIPVKKNPQLFNFACQGPDFFFYYSFWPWNGPQEVAEVGHRIHKEGGGEFVRQAISYLKNYPPTFPHFVDKIGDNPVEIDEYQQLLVYVIGLICHYALDSTTHPFIHYHCGLYRPEDVSTHKYKGNHKYYEAMIDTILLKEKRGVNIKKVRPDIQIDLGENLPQSVITLYQQLVKDFFLKHLTQNQINTAYQDMLKAWRVFYDPLNIKGFLTKLISRLTGGKIKFYQYFYPHTVDNSVDYLNKLGKKWCHPVNNSEVSNTGFYQLWDLAKEQAEKWIGVMFDYLDGFTSEDELRELIPNLSFSTGKEPGVDDEERMQYFGPIISLK